VQGSAFVDTKLDEERITSGLPVIRELMRLASGKCVCHMRPQNTYFEILPIIRRDVSAKYGHPVI
jgi:hypothetical protein